MTSDLHLLEVEIDTLWRKNDRNRLIDQRGPGAVAAPHLVLAVASGGWTLALGSGVPDALADRLATQVDAEPRSSDPASEPTAIARCRQLLEASLGPADLSIGPSYVIPAGTSFVSSAAILRSSDDDIEVARHQDIERLNWTPEDWRQLLGGDLWPWAVAVIDRRVVAVCHSARLAEDGAEAGVWTAPDFRGQGHAAAVTAAWAALLEGSGRHFFYRTSANNFSSQRVAARLRLHPIGWMWAIAAAPSVG